MGSRVDRVNETEQLKAGKKKHPTARSVVQILKNCSFSMPRGTQPWSSNAMLHLQFRWKDLSGNMN